MNHRILFFVLFPIMLTPVLPGASFFPARLAITVSDDDGSPVAGAEVHARTNRSWHPGEGFGRIGESEVRAITDSHGKASIQIDCREPSVRVGNPPTSGYYYTKWKTIKLSRLGNRRWEPWNQAVELVMKGIKNPIPMYARNVFRDKDCGITEYNTPFGFDLMVGDWVQPIGKGVSPEMYFTLLERIPGRAESPPFHYVLRLTFPNSHDGIHPFSVPLNSRSELRLPRIAPSDGFQPVWEGSMRREGADKPLPRHPFEPTKLRRYTDRRNKILPSPPRT